MARLNVVEKTAANGKQAELLGMVEKKLGRVPNMLGTLAQAPAALEAYLVLSETLGGGQLDAGTREQIALTVGSENDCGYCLAAHTAIGKMVGLNDEQVASAKRADATDSKTAAILGFAKALTENRGHVSDAVLSELRAEGVSEGEIAEVVANVSLNIFTNYFNHVADPEIDF